MKLQVTSSNDTATSKNEIQTENLKLKEKIINLETEIAKIKNDFEHKMTEATQISETKMKELEIKFNKEKEETMDAAAVEIESVEKAKNDEIASLMMVKTTLESQLASSKTDARKLTKTLIRVSQQAASLKASLGT